MAPSAVRIACSKSVSPSRYPPSAIRAIAASAAGSAVTPSAFATYSSRLTRSCMLARWNSNF